MVPEATCRRISGTAALSRGTTNDRVCPRTSQATTHNLPLAGAFLGGPAIDALGFLILRLLVAAGIHAIDLNLARQLAATVND